MGWMGNFSLLVVLTKISGFSGQTYNPFPSRYIYPTIQPLMAHSENRSVLCDRGGNCLRHNVSPPEALALSAFCPIEGVGEKGTRLSFQGRWKSHSVTEFCRSRGLGPLAVRGFESPSI